MAELLIMMMVGVPSGMAVSNYGTAAEIAASTLGALAAHALLRCGRRG